MVVLVPERSATIASGSDVGFWGHGPLDTHTQSNEYDSEKSFSAPFRKPISLLTSRESQKYSTLTLQKEKNCCYSKGWSDCEFALIFLGLIEGNLA